MLRKKKIITPKTFTLLRSIFLKQCLGSLEEDGISRRRKTILTQKLLTELVISYDRHETLKQLKGY